MSEPAGPERSRPERSLPKQAGAGRSELDRAAVERSGAERSGAERSGAERSGAERSGAERSGADRSAADRSPAERPDGGVARGHHGQLAVAPAPSAAGPRGAAPGFDPRRTLPLRVELRRQIGRRRTQLTLALVAILPVLLVAAFKIGGDSGPGRNGRITLVDFATVGAANFTLFTVFAASGFLLVIVFALFAGDTVASEASWSSLRYLLIAPIGRGRLLRQKLLVALALSLVTLVMLPVVALLCGWAGFGWHAVQSPTGNTLSTAAALGRLAIIVGYVAVSLLFVSALGFYAGVRTDAPLGAVGSTVLIVIVSDILDNVTALGSLRAVLPTHYSAAWLDALGPTVTWDAMLRGVLSSLLYSTMLFALAWRRFLRKDVVS